MRKWIILLILMLAVTTATAEVCPDQIEIHSNCTMVTPSLNCTSYIYDILNTSGDAIVSGASLTQLNGGLYYLNFTEGAGEYIVRLCDETTRQVIVTDEGSILILAAIILLPLLLGAMLLIGSAILSQEHVPMKIFLFLLSIITFFVSLNWSLITIVKYFDFPVLQDSIGSTVYWFGIIFGVIIMYFLIYLIYKIIKAAAQSREDKMEY